MTEHVATDPKGSKLGTTLKCIGAGLTLLLGSSVFSWLQEWDALDAKANTIIDVLSLSHNVTPESEEVDGFCSFQRVPRKARYILRVQQSLHLKVTYPFYANRDNQFNDKQAWNSALAFYEKTEQKFHPKEFKKVTFKQSWLRTQKEHFVSSKIAAPAYGLSDIELANALSSMGGDGIANTSTVNGIFTNVIPTELSAENYPVVNLEELIGKQVPLSKNAKAMYLSGRKFFIPSYKDIPNSYYANDKIYIVKKEMSPTYNNELRPGIFQRLEGVLELPTAIIIEHK